METTQPTEQTNAPETPVNIADESKSNQDILNELLSGYSKPAEIKEDAPTDTPEPSDIQETDDDKSDPTKYFQSGKKKGQPRPAKRRAVSFEQNSNDPDTVAFGDVLTGAMFIMLIDMLLPLLIEVVNNRFTKHKIKASDLSMTAEQRKRLTPLADGVVKQWNIKANPAVLLLIGFAGVYGMNYAALIQEAKQANKNVG